MAEEEPQVKLFIKSANIGSDNEPSYYPVVEVEGMSLEEASKKVILVNQQTGNWRWAFRPKRSVRSGEIFYGRAIITEGETIAMIEEARQFVQPVSIRYFNPASQQPA